MDSRVDFYLDRNCAEQLLVSPDIRADIGSAVITFVSDGDRCTFDFEQMSHPWKLISSHSDILGMHPTIGAHHIPHWHSCVSTGKLVRILALITDAD